MLRITLVSITPTDPRSEFASQATMREMFDAITLRKRHNFQNYDAVICYPTVRAKMIASNISDIPHDSEKFVVMHKLEPARDDFVGASIRRAIQELGNAPVWRYIGRIPSQISEYARIVKNEILRIQTEMDAQNILVVVENGCLLQAICNAFGGNNVITNNVLLINFDGWIANKTPSGLFIMEEFHL